MKVVALVRSAGTDAAQVLAQASGMALAEAKVRLAPEPPALLARLSPTEADALVAKLGQHGIHTLAWDESNPTPHIRLPVRTLDLGAATAKFVPRSGAALEMAWSDVAAIFRGASSLAVSGESTERRTKFALGTAVLTGGLKMTKTVTTSAKTHEKELEQAIFVFSRAGDAAIFREHQVDFSCLGPTMQPVRIANMAVLVKLLREKASAAFYDERLVRLGTRQLPFVLGTDFQLPGGSLRQRRVNTASGLEVLAEILWQAVSEGLLP